MNQIKKIVYSLGLLGYSPFCPGTVGSVAAVGLWFLVGDLFICVTSFLLLIVLLGLWSVPEAIQRSGASDPQFVIIDELAGYFVAVLGLPFSFHTAIVIFVLFRLFDITKPPPCRSLEKVSGAWGIMLDDIMAGLYANGVYRLGIGLIGLYR